MGISKWTEGAWLPNGEPDLEPLGRCYVWVYVKSHEASKPYATDHPSFYLATHRHNHKINNPDAPELRWFWLRLPAPDKPEIV